MTFLIPVLVMFASAAPPDTTNLVVKFYFEATPAERAAIMDGLRSVLAPGRAPDLRHRVDPTQVHRFGTATEQRYVLLSLAPIFTAPVRGQYGKTFYVLELSAGRVAISPPLYMLDAEWIEFDGVRDVDGDGALDVVYCKAYEGEEGLPLRLAVAYKQGQWVALADSLVSPKDCSTEK